LLTQRTTEWLNEFLTAKQQMDKLQDSKAKSIEFDEMRKHINKLEGKHALPIYFGYGIAAAFVLYSLASKLALLSLLGFDSSQFPLLFLIIATASFAVSGIVGISDINHTLEKEFEEKKRKAEEQT